MFITPTYNFIGKRHLQMGLGCLFSCLDEEGKQMIQIIAKPIDSIKLIRINWILYLGKQKFSCPRC